ncbi:MAG: peptidoglycan DD-metalloendopeptidase family protein [Leeuwenhoekiella sp.]
MQNTDFSAQLASLTKKFTPVIDIRFSENDYLLLDLSVKNPDLELINTASAKDIGIYISEYLINKKALIAYGGYNEKRNIYDRSEYFTKQDSGKKRNIHLGIDIWCDAGTNVLSALPGKVHSFKDNTNHGDYGPCIILEHSINDLRFYTLYGHLSRASLSPLIIDTKIESGDVIAQLGQPFENGDYAPHLHFQIIKDLDRNHGDYPGVSNNVDLAFYLNNCPDPNLLLKLK